MAECDLHNQVSQRIGEFSAKIESLLSQIDRLSRDIIEGGKVDAQLLTEFKNLQRDVTEVHDICEKNGDTFELYKTQVLDMTHKFELLEGVVTSFSTKIDGKIDRVTFDNFCAKHDTDIVTIKMMLDKKASQETTDTLTWQTRLVLGAMVGALISGFVGALIKWVL